MDIWHLQGGNRLEGACSVQGSKNASLPVIAASIITPAESVLYNVPQLRDVDAALRILRHLGCQAQQQDNTVYIASNDLCRCVIPHSLMVEMRSSVIFMGALLARCGCARLSLPGGCQLGKRPIDLHLAALRQMGAEIQEQDGEISCTVSGLHGADIFLPFPSVGATENIMLAASRARGATTIHGAAREPEIVALQNYLSALGLEIWGAGTDTVTISGFNPKPVASYTIIPDRIVSSTIACAAAATGGNVEMHGVEPEHFSTVLHFLNAAGCDIITSNRVVRLKAPERLRSVGHLSTEPYPGFPTDAQPVLMAALLQAEGTTTITENIFENRYRQVEELKRLGADITVSGREAVIKGVDKLHGSTMTATDLRGGASMLVAALSAAGESTLLDDGHVNRGYERFDGILRSLGAHIYLE